MVERGDNCFYNLQLKKCTMNKRKTILTLLWILIALIAAGSMASLILFPQWKGIFFAGMGGFLILNLLLSMFFIRKNFRN